jgi:hypothetical protein
VSWSTDQKLPGPFERSSLEEIDVNALAAETLSQLSFVNWTQHDLTT